jgi:uncharacterized membrane protein YphA (DoxX/SURF4 family)
MTQKAKNITGWVLSILLALIFLSSASMKLMGGEELAKGAAAMGLPASGLKLIGVVEIVSMLLFLIPRTGLLGTLLLAAYLGGAIVTHLEHGQPFLMPVLIQCLVWVTAVIRFPELSKRINGKAIA